MTQLLALAAAAFYGIADFAGGLASRTLSAWQVTAWSQLFGLPLLILGLIIVDAPGVEPSDLGLGAAAGVLGLIGIVLLYSALASGRMSVVAPLVGSLAAAIPVVWDLATGGQINTAHWFGIGFSLGAVILLTVQPSSGPTDWTSIAKAVGAAMTFAAFFIAMSYTNESSGLWPLVGARAASIPLAFAVCILLGVANVPERGLLRLVAFAGTVDMAANLAILLAVQRGPLGISAALSSLYPAFTVVAALVVLKEHPTRLQRVGIVLAVLAAAVLAL